MRLKSLKLLPFLLFSLFAFACESGGDLKIDDNGTTEEPDTPITATIEVSEEAIKTPVAGDTHIVIVESSVNWKAESTGKNLSNPRGGLVRVRGYRPCGQRRCRH